MIIINCIVVLLTLALIYLNMSSIVKSVKIKEKFMYINLVTNDFVTTTIRPYKQRLLMYNRILFIVSLIVAPFIIIFSKTSILLLGYIIIFLIIPFILNQYFITKYVNEIKGLNIASEFQEIEIPYLSLFYNNDDETLTYRYGYRYAFNIAKTKGKALVAAIIALIIIILICLVIFIKPAAKEEPAKTIETNINDTQLVIKYNKQSVAIPVKQITSVKILDDMPKITSKVEGIQENKYNIGTFNTQNKAKVDFFAYSDAKKFLEIKAKNKTYIYSIKDEKEFDNIYKKVQQQVKENTENTNKKKK